MKYKICPGVVLATVCDENMLIATREARDKVGYIRSVNNTGAYLWRLLEKNMSVEEIIKKVCIDYQDKEENIKPLVLRFLDGLNKAGYLEMDGDLK